MCLFSFFVTCPNKHSIQPSNTRTTVALCCTHIQLESSLLPTLVFHDNACTLALSCTGGQVNFSLVTSPIVSNWNWLYSRKYPLVLLLAYLGRRAGGGSFVHVRFLFVHRWKQVLSQKTCSTLVYLKVKPRQHKVSGSTVCICVFSLAWSTNCTKALQSHVKKPLEIIHMNTDSKSWRQNISTTVKEAEWVHQNQWLIRRDDYQYLSVDCDSWLYNWIKTWGRG